MEGITICHNITTVFLLKIFIFIAYSMVRKKPSKVSFSKVFIENVIKNYFNFKILNEIVACFISVGRIVQYKT